MALTYETLGHTTLVNSTTTTVTFSSIPSTYTDIIAVVQGMCTTGLNGFTCDFNQVASGAKYSINYLIGDGSTVVAGRDINKDNNFSGVLSSSQQGTNIIQIFNYSNTTTYKRVLSRIDVPGSTIRFYSSSFRDTAAVNRIDFIMGAGFYSSGTTFTLYGIKAA